MGDNDEDKLKILAIEEAAEDLLRYQLQIQTLAVDPSAITVQARYFDLMNTLLCKIFTPEDLKRMANEVNS